MVASLGGMLAMGSDAAEVVHSAILSAAVVTTSERWVLAPEAVAVASRIGGAAFALASMADSSVVA
jgi:hypothetical protein